MKRVKVFPVDEREDDEEEEEDEDEDDDFEFDDQVEASVDSPNKVTSSSTLAGVVSSAKPMNPRAKEVESFFDRRTKPAVFEVAFVKSQEHKEYVKAHPIGSGLFGTVQIMSSRGKNYLLKCMGCLKEQTGHVSVMCKHVKDCKFLDIEESTRDDHREYVLKEVGLFTIKYGRDMKTSARLVGSVVHRFGIDKQLHDRLDCNLIDLQQECSLFT